MHYDLHGGLAFKCVKQWQQNLLNGPRAILLGAVLRLTGSWCIYEIFQQLLFYFSENKSHYLCKTFGFFKIEFRFLRDKLGRSENLLLQVNEGTTN
jgi:hypothetical protein